MLELTGVRVRGSVEVVVLEELELVVGVGRVEVELVSRSRGAGPVLELTGVRVRGSDEVELLEELELVVGVGRVEVEVEELEVLVEGVGRLLEVSLSRGAGPELELTVVRVRGSVEGELLEELELVVGVGRLDVELEELEVLVDGAGRLLVVSRSRGAGPELELTGVRVRGSDDEEELLVDEPRDGREGVGSGV